MNQQKLPAREIRCKLNAVPGVALFVADARQGRLEDLHARETQPHEIGY